MMLLTAAVLLLTASCSKDDDEPQQVNPPAAAGARLQVMMVFAPGQLGDGGYADGLLEYASGMEFLEIMPDAEDSIDVQFISLYSVNDTRQALKEWAAAVTHPFYKDVTYERRLLVLTEPYMTAWLADVKANLRETDEVLVMKADEAYTQQVADSYGLGSRAHGLNYDLAPSIRLYCDNVRWMIDNPDYAPGFFGDKPEVVILRRFNTKQNYYCDGIEDVIRQQLGNDVNLTVYALADYVQADDLSEQTNVAYIQAAYTAAAQLDQHFQQTGYGFVIADMGTCNFGMLNYLLGSPLYHYEVVMLDSNPYTYNYMAICRDGAAVMTWIANWMRQPAAAMPRFRMADSKDVIENFSEVIVKE